jgi:hypothetical protein
MTAPPQRIPIFTDAGPLRLTRASQEFADAVCSQDESIIAERLVFLGQDGAYPATELVSYLADRSGLSEACCGSALQRLFGAGWVRQLRQRLGSGELSVVALIDRTTPRKAAVVRSQGLLMDGEAIEDARRRIDAAADDIVLVLDHRLDIETGGRAALKLLDSALELLRVTS